MEEILRKIPGVLLHRGRLHRRQVGSARPTTTSRATAATPRRSRSCSTRAGSPTRICWRSGSSACTIPTTSNRQGNDVGTQYRSAIFVTSPEQRQTALAVKERVQQSGKWKRPLVTEISRGGRLHPRRGLPPGLPAEEPPRLHLPLPARLTGAGPAERVGRRQGSVAISVSRLGGRDMKGHASARPASRAAVFLGVAGLVALAARRAWGRAPPLRPPARLPDPRDRRSREEPETISLEDLLNATVSTATKSVLTLEQTPSIVSVFRRDDIERLGAHQLIDLLRFVPGFLRGLLARSSATSPSGACTPPRPTTSWCCWTACR